MYTNDPQRQQKQEQEKVSWNKKQMRYVKPYTLWNNNITPTDYRFNQEVVVDNLLYQQHDYVSLIYFNCQNVFSCQGQMVLIRTVGAAKDTLYLNFDNVQNFRDLITQANDQIEARWPDVDNVSLQFVALNKLGQNIDNIRAADLNSQTQFYQLGLYGTNYGGVVGAENIKVQISGPLQYLVGGYQGEYLVEEFTDDEDEVIIAQNCVLLNPNCALKIRRIKLVCDQLNANFSTSDQYGLVFGSNVVAVVQRESSFQYSNKNLDVMMEIGQPERLRFKIVYDSNYEQNIPCDIVNFNLQIQIYNQEYFSDSGSTLLHTKKQMWLPSQSFNYKLNYRQNALQVQGQNQIRYTMEKPIQQISLTDCQGTLDALVFTRSSSFLKLFKFNATEFYGNNPQWKCFQTKDQLNNVQNLLFFQQACVDGDSRNEAAIYYEDENVWLYDEPEFVQFRDKFINRFFFVQLCTFLNRYYGNDAQLFDATIDLETQNTQFRFEIDTAENFYYAFSTDTFGILYKILPQNPFFNFSKFTCITFNDGQTLYQKLEQQGMIEQDFQDITIYNYNKSVSERGYQNLIPCNVRHFTLSNYLMTLYIIKQFPNDIYNRNTLNIANYTVFYPNYFTAGPNDYQLSNVLNQVDALTPRIYEVNYATDIVSLYVPGQNGNLDAPNSIVQLQNNNSVYNGRQERLFNQQYNVQRQKLYDYSLEDSKLFKYSRQFFIYIDCIQATYSNGNVQGGCIGILNETQGNIQVINNDIWVWQMFDYPNQDLNIKILTITEDPNNRLQQSESKQIPDLLMRFVVK